MLTPFRRVFETLLVQTCTFSQYRQLFGHSTHPTIHLNRRRWWERDRGKKHMNIWACSCLLPEAMMTNWSSGLSSSTRISGSAVTKFNGYLSRKSPNERLIAKSPWTRKQLPRKITSPPASSIRVSSSTPAVQKKQNKTKTSLSKRNQQKTKKEKRKVVYGQVCGLLWDEWLSYLGKGQCENRRHGQWWFGYRRTTPRQKLSHPQGDKHGRVSETPHRSGEKRKKKIAFQFWRRKQKGKRLWTLMNPERRADAKSPF